MGLASNLVCKLIALAWLTFEKSAEFSDLSAPDLIGQLKHFPCIPR